MAQKKTKPIITTEQRSLENQARIIKLEHILLGGKHFPRYLRSALTEKMNRFQETVNRLAQLFNMHGGSDGKK